MSDVQQQADREAIEIEHQLKALQGDDGKYVLNTLGINDPFALHTLVEYIQNIGNALSARAAETSNTDLHKYAIQAWVDAGDGKQKQIEVVQLNVAESVLAARDQEIKERVMASLPKKVKGHPSMFTPPEISEIDYREQTGYNFGLADGINRTIDQVVQALETVFADKSEEGSK